MYGAAISALTLEPGLAAVCAMEAVQESEKRRAEKSADLKFMNYQLRKVILRVFTSINTE